MKKETFQIDKKYVPALGKASGYLKCVQRLPNNEVLMYWSDSGKPVVVSDHSYYSYIEVDDEY